MHKSNFFQLTQRSDKTMPKITQDIYTQKVYLSRKIVSKQESVQIISKNNQTVLLFKVKTV